jgi:hypothetical protein
MLSADWLTGFCTGESNFFIVISGGYAWLRFSVAQDVRDILLLALAPTYVLHMQYSRSRLGSKAENIVRHFNCGYVNKYNNRKVCEFVVTKINDIILNIIPFFDKYPIQGSKYKNYMYFKQAAYIINSKTHLNKKGMDKIIELKNLMNKTEE